VAVPTAVQWLHHFADRVERQRRYAELFERRYTGKHVLDFIVREYAEVYGSAATALPALHPPQTGIAAIGVDALTERLTILGVVSQQDGAEAQRVVIALERAWEDNDLDVMHREAHREALIKRSSYGLVSRGVGGKAVASIEACEQVAVHREQAPPYDIDAAAKFLVDEWTGQQHAKLWLRDRNVELDFVRTETSRRDPEGSDVLTPWQVEAERPLVVPNRVPLVEFANRPRLLADPVSDIEQIATLADIADLCEGLMVFAGHFGAVPIRYATGLEIPRDPADPTKPATGPDGKPLIGFDARADRLWVNTSKDGKFGQLEPAGLASFVSWADHMAEKIRAKTSIPISYYGAGVKTHMSAELLKTDERRWSAGCSGWVATGTSASRGAASSH
jgi:hypothetical protein